jgi:RimJ/RimL family protein N-acetyltransferase
MAWTLTDDLDTFRDTAGAFLRSRPDRHTVLLSVIAALATLGTEAYGDTPPVYGWWRDGGEITGAVTGAFLCTPPYPVALSTMSDEAAASLPEALAGHDAVPPGARGPASVAESFASADARLSGDGACVLRRERLFRLGTLRPPHPAPSGRARPATPDDRDLLIAWWAGFRRDCDLPETDDRRQIDSRIDDGRITLWETGTAPVSMACVGPSAAGTARIGPVYTPKEQRGRGYGGAATAARSQAALDAGIGDVLLFTDLANSTSNALYQRLGYVPVGDYTVYELPSHDTRGARRRPTAAPPGGR